MSRLNKILPKLIILLILCLSLVSCNSKAPAADSLTPGAPAQSLPPEKMRSAIISAFEKQYKQSHRITNQITATDQNIMVDIEFVPPDRYLISSPENYYQKLIIIAKDVYGFANGEWATLPIDPDQLINPKSLEELKATISDIRYLGQETLNNINVDVYEYKSKITIGDSQVDQQSKLWLGVKDGLPYQITMDGQIATMDARTGEIQGVPATTTQTIQYDSSIEIEPPL